MATSDMREVGDEDGFEFGGCESVDFGIGNEWAENEESSV